ERQCAERPGEEAPAPRVYAPEQGGYLPPSGKEPGGNSAAGTQSMSLQAQLESQQQGFLLNLDQTVELGVVNSREYQSFREDLYLAALPVTRQRFSFAWQWAATEEAVRQWAGPESLEGLQNNWTLNSTVGVSKLFSTGALLTADFANKTVF